MRPLNIIIGDRSLCAWQPVAGITWVQTRSVAHNRRLSQRRDGQLVVRGVVGGYLRTYEFQHSLGWAARLIARYTRVETPTKVSINRQAVSTNAPAANQCTYYRHEK